MNKLLKVTGTVFIIAGLLWGIFSAIYGDGWFAALSSILGGFLTGIVFLALAEILDRTDENRYYLEVLLERTEQPEPAVTRPTAPAKRKTKTALESLKDHKFNAND